MKKPQTPDELRYIMFRQKKHENETLPPSSDSLRQTYVWRHCLDGIQYIPSPAGHGWVMEDGELQPLLVTKDPAPSSLVELTTCDCRKSECQTNCSYPNVGLSSTRRSLRHVWQTKRAAIHTGYSGRKKISAILTPMI